MRTNSDRERETALLNAMLRDENWQAASATFKAEALRTFHSHQRTRRLWRWAKVMAAAAVVVAVVGAAHWFGRRAAAPQHVTVVSHALRKVQNQPRHLTDAELVAAFPKGTCFMAEVDGEKELVFFDPRIEHAYLVRSAAKGD